jgi:hypothetical protein
MPSSAHLVVATLLLGGAQAAEPAFERAGMELNRAAWGVRGGLRFAVWPAAVDDRAGDGGPRGLIRVGYPIGPGGSVELVNFIAIEPIVAGQSGRAFSELEPSTDGRPGKLLTARPPPGVAWQPATATAPYPGHIEALPGGVQRLSVRLEVECFGSGAHVWLLASLRTDRPGELCLEASAHEDSPPLAACILTATMGNLERLRVLHLAARQVAAPDLYRDWQGEEFAPHRHFGLAELPRLQDGSVLAAATTNEADPAAVHPNPAEPRYWWYPGTKLTQYWRKPPATFGERLRLTVNARRCYWLSRFPIPGGIAFENIEMNEPFSQGQIAVFGLSPHEPAELLRDRR